MKSYVTAMMLISVAFQFSRSFFCENTQYLMTVNLEFSKAFQGFNLYFVWREY